MNKPRFYGGFSSHFDDKGRGILRRRAIEDIDGDLLLYLRDELWGFRVNIFDETHENRMLTLSEIDDRRIAYFEKGRRITLENTSGTFRFNLGIEYANQDFKYLGRGDYFEIHCDKSVENFGEFEHG